MIYEKWTFLSNDDVIFLVEYYSSPNDYNIRLIHGYTPKTYRFTYRLHP